MANFHLLLVFWSTQFLIGKHNVKSLVVAFVTQNGNIWFSMFLLKFSSIVERMFTGSFLCYFRRILSQFCCFIFSITSRQRMSLGLILCFLGSMQL